MKFTSFDDVQNFLDNLGLFNIDLELTRMNQALTNLDFNSLPYNDFILLIILLYLFKTVCLDTLIKAPIFLKEY